MGSLNMLKERKSPRLLCWVSHKVAWSGIPSIERMKPGHTLYSNHAQMLNFKTRGFTLPRKGVHCNTMIIVNVDHCQFFTWGLSEGRVFVYNIVAYEEAHQQSADVY